MTSPYAFKNPKRQTVNQLLSDLKEFDLEADRMDRELKEYETNHYRIQADAIDQEIRLRGHRERIRLDMKKKVNRIINGRPKKNPPA